MASRATDESDDGCMLAQAARMTVADASTNRASVLMKTPSRLLEVDSSALRFLGMTARGNAPPKSQRGKRWNALFGSCTIGGGVGYKGRLREDVLDDQCRVGGAGEDREEHLPDPVQERR